MRAREFLFEKKSRKSSRKNPPLVKTGQRMHHYHEQSMPEAHRVAGTADRHYDLTKILTLVAAEDGTGQTEHEMPAESWVGRNNTAHPYTPLERDMLKHAYRKRGIEWDDVLHPNPHHRSEEPRDTHKVSPVVPSFRSW